MFEPAVQETTPLGSEPRRALWPEERPATTVGVCGSVPLAIGVFVLQTAAWAAVHWLGGDGALGWAARVMLSAVVVGVLLGLLMTVLARPRADWTVLELAGVGLAVTFGVVQLLAIFSLMAHVPVRFCVSVLVGWNVIGAAALVIDRRPLRIHM